MAETIIIRIKPGTGRATVQPLGFRGPSCLNATANVERALGKTTADDPTPDMHDADVALDVTS
jgi:Protein of unknown function (DUF2997)